MKKPFWVSLFAFLLVSCVSNEGGVDLAVEYYNVGNAFFEVDQFKKAEEYYEKVLAIDTDFHKARYNLIYLQIALSNFQSAIKNINYLKELDATNLRIRKLEAYIEYSEGDLDNALNLYLSVYNSGDISDEIRMNIIKLYYQLEEYDEALIFIAELLISNEDESLYYMAGLVAEGANNLKLSTEYFQSYLAVGGKDIEVLKKLSSIYESQEDYENLKSILLQIIDRKDEKFTADTLFMMGWISLLKYSDFSVGYDFFVNAIAAGFKDKVKVEDLLKEPDLIEVDKIRQLFIEKKIIN